MVPLFENKINELIGILDHGIKTVTGLHGEDGNFSGHPEEHSLTTEESRQSEALMRINHVGEVCAQALYLGQALTAKSDEARSRLLKAAEEEQQHLGWCVGRLEELDGKTSQLSPLFYAASVGLGAVTGMLGDKISLGFVEATEDQVVAHLDRHLADLPKNDERSRTILEAIREDELGHGEKAIEAGGLKYPDAIRKFMTLASKIMTRTTRYI